MHFAETAADTPVGLLDFRFAALIRMNYFFRTESHTDTTGLAPVSVKGNIVQFLFFGYLIFRWLLLVYRCCFCFFCHAFRHSKRKNSYWGQGLSPSPRILFGIPGILVKIKEFSAIHYEQGKGNRIYFLVATEDRASVPTFFYVFANKTAYFICKNGRNFSAILGPSFQIGIATETPY